MELFNTLLSPGVSLMRRLRLRVRLIGMFVLLIVPMLIMGALLAQQSLESGSGIGLGAAAGLLGLAAVLYLFVAFYQSLSGAVDLLEIGRASCRERV